jgi:O-antigen/teichoic acid export membrane protein
MHLFRTSMHVFSARAVQALVFILGYALFARLLGAEQFGVFVLFIALISVLEVFVDLGIDLAVEKRISEYETGNIASEILTTAFVSKTVAILFLGLGMVMFARPINVYVGANVVPFLVAVLFLQQFGALLMSALRGERAVSTAEYVDLGRVVLFVLAGVLLIQLGYGVFGIIYGYIIVWIVICSLAYSLLSTGFGRATTRAFRSLFDFSKYNVVASSVLIASYSWTDVLIIGYILTQAHVAAYEVAWQIAGSLVIVSRAVSTALFPQLSWWASQERYDRIEGIIPDAVTWSTFLIIPGVVGASIVGFEMLSLFFGSEFTIASGALVLILLGRIPESINQIFGTILLATDHPSLVARSALVFIALNLSLNIVLITYFGLVGAAVATGVSFTVFMLMNTYYLSRYVSMSINGVELIAAVLAAGIMGLTLWAMLQWIAVDSIPALLSVILLTVIVYFILLLLTPPYRDKILDHVYS